MFALLKLGFLTDLHIGRNESKNGKSKRERERNNINSISNNDYRVINISRPSYIFEYTTINENHLQFEYVVFLMYNSNMAKGR